MRRVKATKLNAPFFPRSVSRNKTEVNVVDGVNETARDRRLKRMAARDAEVRFPRDNRADNSDRTIILRDVLQWILRAS